MIKAVCDLVGADRVVFGSDYPFGRATHQAGGTRQFPPPDNVYTLTLGEMQALDLPAKEKEKIYYQNAQRLLRLSA